jgi:hypothetical protein
MVADMLLLRNGRSDFRIIKKEEALDILKGKETVLRKHLRCRGPAQKSRAGLIVVLGLKLG